MGNSISICDILKQLKREKAMTAVIIILTAVVMAVLGYISTKSQIVKYENEKKLYDSQMATYDRDMISLSENLATSREQLAEYEAYEAGSIYYQIDPTAVHCAQVHYLIKDCSNVGIIQNAMSLYVNEGSLKQSISENLSIPAEFSKELISIECPSTYVKIGVIAPSDELADEILALIEQQLYQQLDTISSNAVPFELVEVDRVKDVRAIEGMVNAHNGFNNSIKAAKNAIQDYEDKIERLKKAVSEYSEENNPAPVNTPKTAAVKWAVLGIIAGVLLAFAYLSAKYICSDILKGASDLSNANLPVFAQYDRKKDTFSTTVERTMLELSLICQKSENSCDKTKDININDERKRVVYYLLKGVDRNLLRGYEAAAETNGINLLFVEEGTEDVETLKNLSGASGVVLVMVKGISTYENIENSRSLFERFSVRLLGGIIVE